MKLRFKVLIETPTRQEFWMKVLNEKQELSVLVFKLSTIRFSNNRIERDFSLMNLCKTKLQLRMGSTLLIALMVIINGF